MGFVDTETGCLKRAEHLIVKGDSNATHYYKENSYTLVLKDSIPEEILPLFDDKIDCHKMFFAKTSTNSMVGLYSVDYETGAFQICRGGWSTMVGEIPDGNRYNDALHTVQSFFLQKTELRLYYNNNQNYLLFKTQ